LYFGRVPEDIVDIVDIVKVYQSVISSWDVFAARVDDTAKFSV